MEIHPSALRHGVAVEDIEHAVRNAMVSDELDDDLRLYLGSESERVVARGDRRGARE